MEERVPGEGRDDPPILSNDIIALPDDKPTSTYVIKVPRDQIYRVPPPENAIIHRNSVDDGNNMCGGGRLLCTFVAVILIGLVALFTFNHFSDHKLPEFSVLHFGRNANQYAISLRIFNPNGKLEIRYGDGHVSLNYKGHEIASGKSMLVKQDGGSTVVVNQVLAGAKKEKSPDDKLPAALIVRINVPIEAKAWIFDSFKTDIAVRCELEVDSLGEGAKLLSQKCATN